MAIYLGSDAPAKLYAGADDVRAVYLGGTKVWESAPAVPIYQIVDIAWWGASHSENGIDFTRNADGSITADGTASNGAFFAASTRPAVKSGHKYYIRGGSMADGYCTNSYDASAWGAGGKTAPIIVTAIADRTLGAAGLRAYVTSGTHVDNEKLYPQIFDLTAMFGAGNEPTIAEFDAMFPAEYYPYNPVP